MQEKEAPSLQLFCCGFAFLLSSQCQASADALLGQIYIINACQKKKLNIRFASVLGYFLFPQTVHVRTWLNCCLSLITSATPNHALSCQILCSYPGVVGNAILFQPQHVIWFHLGVTKQCVVPLPLLHGRIPRASSCQLRLPDGLHNSHTCVKA